MHTKSSSAEFRAIAARQVFWGFFSLSANVELVRPSAVDPVSSSVVEGMLGHIERIGLLLHHSLALTRLLLRSRRRPHITRNTKNPNWLRFPSHGGGRLVVVLFRHEFLADGVSLDLKDGFFGFELVKSDIEVFEIVETIEVIEGTHPFGSRTHVEGNVFDGEIDGETGQLITLVTNLTAQIVPATFISIFEHLMFGPFRISSSMMDQLE